MSCLVALTTAASAYDGDWKRGRVYYQGVCTPCHKAATKSEGIPATPTPSPNGTPICGRQARRGKDTLKQYVSQAYRGEIKATNKVADSFLSVPDEDLLQDVKAFVVNGAKDGDAPAGCN